MPQKIIRDAHINLLFNPVSTWSEGPYGNKGVDPGKSISYYYKGLYVGLVLDFAIRHATNS